MMATNYEIQILADLYENLVKVSYRGTVRNFTQFMKCFIPGSPNEPLLDVSAWLGLQLIYDSKKADDIRGELVNPNHPFKVPLFDRLAFFVQMSSLIWTLNCPIKVIQGGNLSEKLKVSRIRAILLQYLLQELQATKVKDGNDSPKGNSYKVLSEQTDLGLSLKNRHLVLDKSSLSYFNVSKYDELVCELSKPLLPGDLVGPVLFADEMTDEQWIDLDNLHEGFFEEYKIRRQMSITRASVTMTSLDFLGDLAVTNSEEINGILGNFMKNSSIYPNVEIPDVIAATADSGFEESISSAAACGNTHGTVNEVVIGNVPDRGGRPSEQAPPPPEVPGWQVRSDPRSGRAAFPPPKPNRGSFFQANRNSPRPVNVVEPMVAVPVAGDNFAQFGNSAPEAQFGNSAPEAQFGNGALPPMVLQQWHTAPPMIVHQLQPGVIFHPQPQLGWGQPPGFPAFSGGPNVFRGQGARGGPNGPNVVHGAQGGPSAAFGGQPRPTGGFGRYAGQRGPGRQMRGGRGGGGRGSFEGFGGFHDQQ